MPQGIFFFCLFTETDTPVTGLAQGTQPIYSPKLLLICTWGPPIRLASRSELIKLEVINL